MKLEDVKEGLPRTDLLYWQDSYLRQFDADILRVAHDEKRYFYLVLNRTLFHPKGGGQPSDKGTLTGPGFKFSVNKAMIINDVVVHWGKLEEGSIKPGPIRGEIDWAHRYLYMRRHTAAHLFDGCLLEAGLTNVETTDSWLGDNPYVGYAGDLPTIDMLKTAERIANERISNGAVVNIEIVSKQTLISRANNAPNLLRLPDLPWFRIVAIAGHNPIPCGGTHLKNIAEINRFAVKNSEKSDKGFRVYFDIS